MKKQIVSDKCEEGNIILRELGNLRLAKKGNLEPSFIKEDTIKVAAMILKFLTD